MRVRLAITVVIYLLAPKQLFGQTELSSPLQAYRAVLEDIHDKEESWRELNFQYTQTIADDKGNRLVRRYDLNTLDNGAVVLESRGKDLSNLQIDWSVPLLLNAATFTALDPHYCEEDGKHWVFCTLAPVSVDLDNEEQARDANRLAQENLRSQIWITKEKPQITKMTIFNTEAFHPSPLARVDRFEIALEFAPAWLDGPLITAKASRRLKGKYGFFISLDEFLVQTITDISQNQLAEH